MKRSLLLNKSDLTRLVGEVVLVLLFCGVFVFLTTSFTRSACATYDETVHLASGYTYLKWHDYRISPSHPPLVKKIAALPLLWQHVWPETIIPNDDDFSSSRFFDSERVLHTFWSISLKYPNSEWNFAHELLYGIRRETQQSFAVGTPLEVPTTASLSRSDFYNHPDRLLGLARLAVLPLALALAILVYLWSRQVHGTVAAGLLSLALFVFDPNFIANGGLVTTDVAFALFFFGTIYFYWRSCRHITIPSLALFALFFGAAFATKFSAVLLIPVFGLIALVRIYPRDNSQLPESSVSKPESRLSKAGTQLFLFAFAGLVSFTIVWASYDLRYSAAVDPGLAAKQEEEAIRAISIHSSSVSYGRLGHLSVEQELRRVAAIKALSQKFDAASVTEKAIAEAIPLVQLGRFSQLILFLNDHRLLPEGYLEGLAILREASLSTPSYLRGEYSNAGFRSYFLWTFLLKTPLPAIVAIVAGIALAFYRKMSWARDFAFLLLPVAIGVLSLIPAHINIGHRHLLFVYPFLYVFAGGIARELPQKARGTWTLAGVITVLAASSSFVFYPLWRPQVIFPHFLAYFNELAGGPLNGWRSLADSNIDWGQDLPGLKAWLDRNNIREPVYLSYFGTADPRFYQIIHKPVPTVLGGYDFTAPPNENPYEATNLFQRALQPGDYIAISAHNVIGVRLSPGARDVWQQIFNRSTLVDRIGYSIFIYRVNG